MARVRAPELSGAGGWIGTAGPLSLTALAGKVVLLHFWTFANINCIRVLAELRAVEERFASEVVVVGVHSPKFPHEHEHVAVERAVQRMRITHPVLDDPDLTTWQHYSVRGWPTVVVIDPEGNVVGGVSGEGCGQVLTETILELIAAHDVSGTGALARGPIPQIIGTMSTATSLSAMRILDHPGNVAVAPGGGLVAIADTGHDRVIICDPLGRIDAEYGSLHQPQGLCFDGPRLIVCDTGLDRVVAVDLANGEQTLLAAGLASPWDVVLDADGSVVVAEAGRHRLWRIARGSAAAVITGAGEGNLVDGPAGDAFLAQPSGLTRVPGGVILADADASALRVLTDDLMVRTLVGQGLFDWGASDGGPDSSALQHPQGVAADPAGANIYIADTFNSMLRVWSGSALTAASGSLRTLPVEGLDEPGGLDLLADGRLLVADTNHHRVVIVDPATGAVEPFILDDSWIGITRGAAISAGAGSPVEVPFEVDVGDLALNDRTGPAVRIEVTADPPTLLGPGGRVWAQDVPKGLLDVPRGPARFRGSVGRSERRRL